MKPEKVQNIPKFADMDSKSFCPEAAIMACAAIKPCFPFQWLCCFILFFFFLSHLGNNPGKQPWRNGGQFNSLMPSNLLKWLVFNGPWSATFSDCNSFEGQIFVDLNHRPHSRQVTGARCTEVAARQSWAVYSSRPTTQSSDGCAGFNVRLKSYLVIIFNFNSTNE